MYSCFPFLPSFRRKIGGEMDGEIKWGDNWGDKNGEMKWGDNVMYSVSVCLHLVGR